MVTLSSTLDTPCQQVLYTPFLGRSYIEANEALAAVNFP